MSPEAGRIIWNIAWEYNKQPSSEPYRHWTGSTHDPRRPQEAPLSEE